MVVIEIRVQDGAKHKRLNNWAKTSAGEVQMFRVGLPGVASLIHTQLRKLSSIRSQLYLSGSMACIKDKLQIQTVVHTLTPTH